MKYFILAAVFSLLFTSGAHAAEAYANAKINLRAGPDGGYPVVDILKRKERVELLGCIQGYQWCEVKTRQGERGWVFAHYLNASPQHGGQTITIIQSGANTRIITFRPNNYWDTHYRTKYFYRDRYKWIPRDYNNRNYNHPHDHEHTRPEKPETKPAQKLSDRPEGTMPMPSRMKYDPACPIGVKTC